MAEGGSLARLYVLAGSDLARSFGLGERTTLGRSSECDVVLHDRSISRKHALVARHEGVWFLQDLGSTNGISKAGKRLERFELADGDEFLLGDLPLRFRLAEAERSDEVEFVFAPSAPTVPVAPVVSAVSAPPPVPVATVAEEPVVEEEIEIEEEIELDDAATDSRRAPAEPALAATMYRPRTERHTGFFSGDLEQRPWWWKGLIALFLLAFCAGLCYGAFWAVHTLRAGL